MNEQSEKEVTIANRVVLAFVSALVSAGFWFYLLEYIEAKKVMGPNPKVVLGLVVISVVAVDRIYLKLTRKQNAPKKDT